MNDFKTRPEEAAYPILNEQFGLTKREYFAALAMQGLLAQMQERTSSAQIAKEAVMCADKLIESLNK